MSKAKSFTFGISTRFSSQEGIIGRTNPPSRTLTFSIKPKIHARIRYLFLFANSKTEFIQINLKPTSLQKAPIMAPFISFIEH